MGAEITTLLQRARDGDQAAWGSIADAIYADLRRIAHRQLAQHARPGGEPTLNTTGLVHECWLRLAGAEGTIRDRGHFLALAARAMRQIIVDYARARLADKRGGGDRGLPFDEIQVAEQREAERMLEIDDLLRQLERLEPRQARVVECRFFAGLSETDTALALEVSERSVQRDWQAAREWLKLQMQG